MCLVRCTTHYRRARRPSNGFRPFFRVRVAVGIGLGERPAVDVVGGRGGDVRLAVAELLVRAGLEAGGQVVAINGPKNESYRLILLLILN